MEMPGYYREALRKMAVNRNKGKVAPHKAVLLLTVAALVASGELVSPLVPLTDNFVNAFNRMWKMAVPVSSSFNCNVAYPFYHLSSSPFWFLVRSSSYVERVEYSSVKALRESFDGAVMDVGLFRLLQDESARREICELLMAEFLDPKVKRLPIMNLLAA